MAVLAKPERQGWVSLLFRSLQIAFLGITDAIRTSASSEDGGTTSTAFSGQVCSSPHKAEPYLVRVFSVSQSANILGTAPTQMQHFVLGPVEPSHLPTCSHQRTCSHPFGWHFSLLCCQLHLSAWRHLQTC